jgi:MtN3 and saliva related transmembrane protein
MFAVLTLGVALWVAYGILQSDMVIVIANVMSLLLLAGILYYKLREMFGGRSSRSRRKAKAS